MFIILAIRHSSTDHVIKLICHIECLGFAEHFLSFGFLLQEMPSTGFHHLDLARSGHAKALLKR